MFIEQPPHLFRRFYKNALWRKSSSVKTVYLTFDDGPCEHTTLQVLELLDYYKIKATFFCVGENVERHPSLFQEIKNRGHRVGNHTMYHSKGFNFDVKTYVDSVEKADKLIQSNLFRPPYGRIKFSQYKVLNKKYTVVMWDVISRDYNPKLSPKKVCSIVKKYARNGSIIVFHDSIKAKQNVLNALPETIEFLKEKGFEFGIL